MIAFFKYQADFYREKLKGEYQITPSINYHFWVKRSNYDSWYHKYSADSGILKAGYVPLPTRPINHQFYTGPFSDEFYNGRTKELNPGSDKILFYKTTRVYYVVFQAA